MREWRIVGLSFEHAHMGDLLREVHEHPNAEIAGVWDTDKARMADAIANFSIPRDRVYGDHRAMRARDASGSRHPLSGDRAACRRGRGGRCARRRHPARKAVRRFARRRRPDSRRSQEVGSAARNQLAVALVSVPRDDQAADRRRRDRRRDRGSFL